MKHRKRRWWKKCKESIVSLFTLRKKEYVKENEAEKEARRPKVRQTLGKIGRWLLLRLLLRQWAWCQRCSRMTAEKDGGDGKDAARSAGKSRQMGMRFLKGGGSQRRTQD